MKATTPTFVIELPLRVNDQQNRFLTQAFEFGRTLYNATLGTALGQLQRMRESKEWRETRDMPKGKERSERFSELQRTRRLTENGLRTIANNHRKASGRNDIGAHEAQCIGRRTINGKKRWFAQICLEGQPPVRKIYAPQSEVVGIDPGPSQIAYYHENYVDIVKVAPNVNLQEKVVRRLQRKIDRSRRANNPDNYEDDGRIRRGPLKWKFSHRLNKRSRELAEHHRCLAATRKRDHGALANLLLQIGGTVKIEKNSYRSYQRNFGKSTTRSGMGAFIEHLKRSAERAGAKVVELNAYALKMSQYDPATDTYRKKTLKERWHRWGNSETLVQRDVMSAYLACYATEKGHNRALLLEKWPTAEVLLSGSGLCRQQPRSDQGEQSLRLTKPQSESETARARGLPRTLCATGDVRTARAKATPSERACCWSK